MKTMLAQSPLCTVCSDKIAIFEFPLLSQCRHRHRKISGCIDDQDAPRLDKRIKECHDQMLLARPPRLSKKRQVTSSDHGT